LKVYSPARLDLHESGTIGQALTRTSTAIGVIFFFFDLEYLKRVQSSEPLNTKMPPTFSTHGLYRILSSYWLAHCYLVKKEQLFTFLAFLETSLVEKNAVCARMYNPSARD
jgi:hypothetical protein